MPVITVGYKTEQDGNLTGWIHTLKRKTGSIYEGRSDSEIGRRLIRKALVLEMTEGDLKELVQHLSKKQGSEYEGKSEVAIRRMLLSGSLEEDLIDEWLAEVANEVAKR